PVGMTKASATKPRKSRARITAIAIDSTVSLQPPSAGLASFTLSAGVFLDSLSLLVLDMGEVGQVCNLPRKSSKALNGRLKTCPTASIRHPSEYIAPHRCGELETCDSEGAAFSSSPLPHL